MELIIKSFANYFIMSYKHVFSFLNFAAILKNTMKNNKAEGRSKGKKPGERSKFKGESKKPYPAKRQGGKKFADNRSKEDLAPKKVRPGIKNYNPDEMRLNKYIAHAGICSRREADKLIGAGAVTVNGVIVTDLGIKVKRTDNVHVGEQRIRPERPVYVLLNKPKGFITTTEDPFDRKTVMSLVKDACKERLYPVGRLDRNTTGLLLFTNDGEMAEKLMHPSNSIHKIYHASLDKNLKQEDMDAIAKGIKLEDGQIKADDISYVNDGDDHRQVGLEIHSGRNRIVRRIFEHLGYQVVKLDRVIFAGLTKKDLPRSKWRFLSAKEIDYLKML